MRSECERHNDQTYAHRKLELRKDLTDIIREVVRPTHFAHTTNQTTSWYLFPQALVKKETTWRNQDDSDQGLRTIRLHQSITPVRAITTAT